MSQSDSGDDRLPGELPIDLDDRDTLKAVGLKMIKESLRDADDDFLAASLAMYHEEWERRNGEVWVIEE